MIITLIVVGWLLVGLIGARIQYNWAHADSVRLDRQYPKLATVDSVVTKWRSSDIRLALALGPLFGPIAVLCGVLLWIFFNPTCER